MSHSSNWHLGLFPLAVIVALVALACAEEGIEGPSIPTPPGAALGKVAFVSDGEIWVKDLPDGQPQRLTADGSSREPRWSSTGQWLAFRKADGQEGGTGQVWVVRADGSQAHPLKEGIDIQAFAWAPTADRLAYVTDHGALVVENADASDQRELVTPDGGTTGTGVINVAWSPDGEWLAYDWVEIPGPGGEGQPPDRYTSLWRIGADGSEASELLNAGRPSSYGLILAGWSPDGSHILYWVDPVFSASILADGVPLYTVPASGGGPHQLDEGMLLHPDFWAASPSSNVLAITEGGGRETWTNKRIALVDVSNAALTYLTEDTVAALSPSWSPDGERIAYVAGPDIGFVGGGEAAKVGAAERRIWVMNRDGSDKRQLTNDPAYRDERPLWSKDSSYILFARLDANDAASLWLIPTEGGEPSLVAQGLPLDPQTTWFGYYGYIDWSQLFGWYRG